MHDIGALHLSSSRWIDRRVDRFEFVGLTTIHHTITLTLDLRRLPTDTVTLPIGMFGRQRPPGQVVDAAGAIVRHLSSANANALLTEDVRRRLASLGVSLGVDAQLTEITRHRADRCDRLTTGPSLDGYADLAGEKWGCPAVGVLLRELAAVPGTPREVDEVVRLLCDWQNCDPLVVEIKTTDASFGTLVVSFDEELTPWLSPWDRRRHALARTEHRDRDVALDDRRYAALVSRGGPFQTDLNLLVPRPPRLWLSRSRVPRLRRLGRFDVRHLVWHVAWEQWAVGSIERHVEVVVPPELAVVRLRSLRPNGATPDLADQVGPRAHITLMPEQRESPELLSVLLCHRDGQSWTAGAVIALITAILLVLAVWFDLKTIGKQLDASATVIVLGPAFTAGLLSARATSEIADTLLIGLRRLLAASAVCIALSAAFLVATTGLFVQVAVTALAVLLGALGSLLEGGALRSHKLRRESQERDRPGRSPRDPSRLAAAPHRQRTPRPDRFIVSGEGERMPWGWLESTEGDSSLNLGSRDEDRLYWSRVFTSEPDEASIAKLVEFGRRAAKAGDESRAL